MQEAQSTKEMLEKILEAVTTKPQKNIFPEGSVPIGVAARVYGKDACWIRAGIIAGWLPIGVATRNGEKVTSVKEMDSRKGRILYFISPKKLYEDTGYLWDGKEN